MSPFQFSKRTTNPTRTDYYRRREKRHNILFLVPPTDKANVFIRERRGGRRDLPALCRSWIDAGVHGVELAMQYGLGV